LYKNKRELYKEGETKQYKNTEYTKQKTNMQNKKTNIKIIFKNISQ
jgi:hypothetical protein